MAQEQKHEREYKRNTLKRNSALYAESIQSIISFDEENILHQKDAAKLKNEKKVKILKVNDDTKHAGRAKNAREIVKKTGIAFIKNPKERQY